ncbi:putative signal peptide protein [Puccinia sorghi]|uniref:Putative signal peptide protein n=1 Tax=Puccinia sorghi TaxID=27349 RepID=A0A0L6VR41_9BASI|nr:putative signal peptide protein [Puccinia sorghi]
MPFFLHHPFFTFSCFFLSFILPLTQVSRVRIMPRVYSKHTSKFPQQQKKRKKNMAGRALALHKLPFFFFYFFVVLYWAFSCVFLFAKKLNGGSKLLFMKFGRVVGCIVSTLLPKRSILARVLIFFFFLTSLRIGDGLNNLGIKIFSDTPTHISDHGSSLNSELNTIHTAKPPQGLRLKSTFELVHQLGSMAGSFFQNRMPPIAFHLLLSLSEVCGSDYQWIFTHCRFIHSAIGRQIPEKIRAGDLLRQAEFWRQRAILRECKAFNELEIRMKIPGEWIFRHEVNSTDFEVDDPPEKFNSMDISPHVEVTELHISEAQIHLICTYKPSIKHATTPREKHACKPFPVSLNPHRCLYTFYFLSSFFPFISPLITSS